MYSFFLLNMFFNKFINCRSIFLGMGFSGFIGEQKSSIDGGKMRRK